MDVNVKKTKSSKKIVLKITMSMTLSDSDDRGVTPAPMAKADRPPVPLFNDPPPDNDVQDEEGEGGMILFSELLSATGGLRVDANDEDGFDGAILFGDAGERKELLWVGTLFSICTLVYLSRTCNVLYV